MPLIHPFTHQQQRPSIQGWPDHWEQFEVKCLVQGHFDMRGQLGIEPPTMWLVDDPLYVVVLGQGIFDTMRGSRTPKLGIFLRFSVSQFNWCKIFVFLPSCSQKSIQRESSSLCCILFFKDGSYKQRGLAKASAWVHLFCFMVAHQVALQAALCFQPVRSKLLQWHKRARRGQ